MGDNASWHLSQYTQKEMTKRNISFIKNVAYAPDLNPIEKVFLQIKTNYRKQRLNKLLQQKIYNPKDLLLQVTKEVNIEGIRNNIRAGLFRWSKLTVEEALSDTPFKQRWTSN